MFDNAQTGLQPIQAQGAFSLQQDLGPTNIRITGYGVDSGTTNQTNQTHVGPNAGSSGTTMRYVTDTQGGNSGSPETPAWISYDWGASQRLVTEYRITNTNGSLTSRAPKDFTLQGHNGGSWVTLDTRTGQTGWVSGVTRTFAVANPGFFTDLRLHITDDNDSRSGVVVISIGDLQFAGCQ